MPYSLTTLTTTAPYPFAHAGFHKAYLEACIAMFGRCTQQTVNKLEALTAGAAGELGAA